jgi:flagellar M-ring protein FliF
MNGVLEGLRTLGAVRLAAMGIVAAAVFVLLLVVALRGSQARMGLLYSDLDLREAAQMTDILEHERIPHLLAAGGSEILVPADRVAQVRLRLARDGLPSGGSVGYEIFDRGDGLLTSQFTQRINETRALEGELARTIEAIRGVRAARVHLVLPHREPFARDQQPAQASVLLTLAANVRLGHEEVQAILNLVAAAVPGLRPENIALADSRGTLLARTGQSADALGGADTVAELQHNTEQRLARAVEEMLERSLGPGHVQAEATIEMDLDRVHETQERFDPDGQVVRSTQTVNDNSRSTDVTATTSVQNNLPNPDPAQGGAGSQEQRQEETTNYEINKTVRSIVREHPQIRRISLAVLVDGIEERDSKGATHWQPRSPEELARITALVKSAIGYDEKRGDHVEVATMPFAHPDEAVAPSQLLGMSLERSDIIRLAQTALIGVLGLAALAFVLRPTILRIARLSDLEGSTASLALAGLAPSGGRAGESLLANPASPPQLAPPRVEGRSEEPEAMVAVANIEGQLRASSIRRIADLVEKHPEESLAIVRTWMQQGAS